MLVSFVTKARD